MTQQTSFRLPSESRLKGEFVEVHTLRTNLRDKLYRLLKVYYDNVTVEAFHRDLQEKQWVFLLTERATGQVRGFSTLMQLEVEVQAKSVIAYFSGDTIVDREFWGDGELVKIWLGEVISMAEATSMDAYWMLISSGYKTYRLLPSYFQEFYPVYDRSMPEFIRQRRDAFAQLKFGDDYEPHTGLVHMRHATPLSVGVATITPRHLEDPHIAFFTRVNSGYLSGDELVCLTPLKSSNLTPEGQHALNLYIAAHDTSATTSPTPRRT